MSGSSDSVKRIGVLSLVMITVGSVDSIRNLPASALLGSHLIFFYLISALLFFIPSALVAAELSSSSTQRAGIYDWVSNAFGSLCGLFAVWFQWTENLFWYPLILSLIVKSVLSYFLPGLGHEQLSGRLFVAVMIILLFWCITLINLRGVQSSARFATICAILGLIIPFIFIMTMGVLWWVNSPASSFSLNFNNLVPSLNDPGWSQLTVIMLSLMGIEIATVHSSNVDKPDRAYPWALFISSVLLLFTLIGGSLALAVVLPPGQSNPFTAITFFFNRVCGHFHLDFLVPFLIIAVVIGLIGSVNNWVIAPTRGLCYAASQGCLPKVFMSKNKHDAPRFMLLLQGVMVSLISLTFVIFPHLVTSFNLLTAIASQQYACMYILMFATAVKQRYGGVSGQTGFKVPGGNWVLLCLASLGMLSMFAVLVVGLLPSAHQSSESLLVHEVFLIGGMLFFLLLALFLYRLAKRQCMPV
jgi:glutamate:GABA antiporter